MTLAQLNAFVLVARLGSVKAAAHALGVSEPAVSQALTALRRHLGDSLIERGASGMVLTAGGDRLLPVAVQMIALGAQAEAVTRDTRAAPERLRLVATSTIAEFVATPLLDAFVRRFGTVLRATSGVATAREMGVLVADRLADLALGPGPCAASRSPQGTVLVSEPVFCYRLVAVTGGRTRPRGPAERWPWLVDPSGTDPASDTGRLLARLGVAEHRVRVFANQTAAWAAAADGSGVSPAPDCLVAHRIRRGELSIVDTPATPMDGCWHATTLRRGRRAPATTALRRFLDTPEAIRLMRSPGAGVPPSRFCAPVRISIWS